MPELYVCGGVGGASPLKKKATFRGSSLKEVRTGLQDQPG